jgi:hypothetical protein
MALGTPGATNNTKTRKAAEMNANKLFKRILGLGLGAMFTVSAAAAPAVVEKGTAVLYLEGDVYSDCFGEVMHFNHVIPYRYHRVQLPNGNYVYQELWIDSTLTAVGLETGTVWTAEKNVSPYIERTTGGGMVHFTDMVTWVSDTGLTIELRSVLHLSFDANGELRVDRLEFRCWERD